MRTIFSFFQTSFLGLTFLLFAFGLLMIYSGSPKLALQQLFFGLLGFVLFLILRQVDYRIYKKIAVHIYSLGIFLLMLVILFGTEIRGSTRWFDLAIFRFQPSELVKPLLIIVLASFTTNFEMERFKNYLLSFAIIALPVLLVLKQPDLGNSVILVSIWFALVLVSSAKFLYLAVTAIFSVLGLPIIYKFLAPYQQNRIIAFLNPAHDPLGIGYSVIQSQIAIGSGQWFGRGFGRGTQSHLQFLPEFNTDFIFATLAEELGFAGAIILLIIFLALIVRLLRLASQIQDPFGGALIIGVATVLLVHLTINVGMNLGLLPVTGITLPLVSYGGSSLVSTFILLGIAASVERFSAKAS